jgi:hypothetical protein
MPVVFSPGEAETRPLYPDDIVYTTAQKVADLLGVGRGEAVAASADTEADRVYVTGADYRDHGFAAGDTILIYSDAQALGVEKEITVIAEGGANGVALYFSPLSGVSKVISNISDYQTADNTYIQNTASFTSGKTRGMTRATVEDFIKRIQDRIDNVTHNAWRPYMAIAEYINFDTYKPYRRRYYTDYVGTAPLVFRNVQQILRLEIWQGDNYREIGCAEARIELVDSDALAPGEGLFIGVGNADGSAVSLVTPSTSPTPTTTWRNHFDNVTDAQNLADLINKEDRTEKTVVEFSPAFTLEGSTSNVGVHNEILATANSDYGNGKLKLTSMRQTKGGENVSIASSDLTNLTISKVTEASTTSTSVSGATVNVASTAGFARSGVLMVGSGSSIGVLRYTGKNATQFTGCANLFGTPLTTLNSSDTAAFQYLFKSGIGAFSDAGGDQARLKDWWLDSEMGIIYFNNSYPYFEWNAVKVSYIYGERYLEKAIEEVATKLVASELLMSDDRSVLIPEGTQNVDLGSKIQLWRKEAETILNRYKEMVVFA